MQRTQRVLCATEGNRVPIDGEEEKLRCQRGEREGRDGAQGKLSPERRQAREDEAGVQQERGLRRDEDPIE